MSQSVLTLVRVAIREISSTRKFRVPARDLESLLGSMPMLRATSLWLIPAVLIASRTRLTRESWLLPAPLLVSTTSTFCTEVAILAIVTGEFVSFS